MRKNDFFERIFEISKNAPADIKFFSISVFIKINYKKQIIVFSDFPRFREHFLQIQKHF